MHALPGAIPLIVMASLRLCSLVALLVCCNAFTLRVKPHATRTLRAAPAVCAADDEPKGALSDLSDEQKEALRQIAQDFFPVCPAVHVHCYSLACVMLAQPASHWHSDLIVACVLFRRHRVDPGSPCLGSPTRTT